MKNNKQVKKSFFDNFGFGKKASAEQKSVPHYAQSINNVAYFSEPGKPVWMPREYQKFAEEAYSKNVVAHRCVSMVAQSIASIGLTLHDVREDGKTEIKNHPILSLLSAPNPGCSGRGFMETLVSHRMISGNAYILSVGGDHPAELHALRPDRVQVIAGSHAVPAAYQYQVGNKAKRYPVDSISGRSDILHLKQFHPLNDWYGMSPIEAASYSIDQHNQAANWNQALMQNGAKPSGALVVQQAKDGTGGVLSDEQYARVKGQIEEQYSGAMNAGRPLLLEGGLDWKEMSLSPKDMDFIESKNSSARDIALAFGVPPQLLGIPGDNTYSNLAEARLALWEQTILPLMHNITCSFNQWLVPQFEAHPSAKLEISYDVDNISALAPRREAVWNRIKGADFLNDDEKRAMVGV